MDLKTTGIAIHEVVLHHLYFTPLKSLFKQGISFVCFLPILLLGLLQCNLAHKPKELHFDGLSRVLQNI